MILFYHKHIFNFFVFLLIVYSFLSTIMACKDKHCVLEHVKDCNYSYDDSLELTVHLDELSYISRGTSTFFYFIGSSKRNFYLFLGRTDKSEIQSIKITNLNDFDFDCNRLPVIKSFDSIYFISNSNMILVNNNGVVIKKYKLAFCHDDANDSFIVNSSFDSPVIAFGNKFVGIKTYLHTNSMGNMLLSTFFKKPYVVFHISGDSCVFDYDFGRYPLIYQQKFYYDIYPFITLKEMDQFLVSYGIIDSLYEYDDLKLNKTASVKSASPTLCNEFCKDSLVNYSYIDKYLFTEFRYLQTVYDTYNNLYYRIVKHNSDDNNEFCNWSLMIFNDSFQIVDEIKFDPGQYSYESIIPTQSGLLISKRKPNTNNTISYGLFKVIKGR